MKVFEIEKFLRGFLFSSKRSCNFGLLHLGYLYSGSSQKKTPTVKCGYPLNKKAIFQLLSDTEYNERN